MAEYVITYTNGDTETVEADRVEWQGPNGDHHYWATDAHGDVLFVAHFNHLRSIRRFPASTTRS
ncbi:hypothetical protein [Streptomyces omiyaensis]|uniref:hypothetical protein n=1 Tax=Streptomyces omiyaensis TaxID=68247 RepID=UPI0036F757F4